MVSHRPTCKQVEEAVSQASQASVVVLATHNFNAHYTRLVHQTFDEQVHLAWALADARVNVVIASIENPFGACHRGRRRRGRRRRLCPAARRPCFPPHTMCAGVHARKSLTWWWSRPAAATRVGNTPRRVLEQQGVSPGPGLVPRDRVRAAGPPPHRPRHRRGRGSRQACQRQVRAGRTEAARRTAAEGGGGGLSPTAPRKAVRGAGRRGTPSVFAPRPRGGTARRGSPRGALGNRSASAPSFPTRR